jgi:hypothetical protein
MALSPKKQCERARAKWDIASTTFNDWAIANGYGNVVRSELEKALVDVPAGLTLLAADNAAREAWTEADSAAVAAGHAWRGSFGSVNFYSASDVRRFAAQRRRFA